MERNIIQIIPASENLYAVYGKENETGTTIKVACLALAEEGGEKSVYPIVFADDGTSWFADELAFEEECRFWGTVYCEPHTD